MTALNRKLARDLLHMKGQVVAIALVMACGVAAFITSLTTLLSLQQSQDRYYDTLRFAHIFAQMKRAPLALADRIAEIPGVAAVDTRIVADVKLDLPGLDEPAVGRLISVPEFGRPRLNVPMQQWGRWIEPGRPGEVVVSEPFAQAHNLGSGDHLRAVINGRLRELTVVGAALSPEFIYEIREGDLLPDSRRFGVIWIGYDELAAAFDLDGAFNNVTLRVLPGVAREEVLDRLDDLIDEYGGLASYDRADQTSHRFVANELKQLRAMSTVAPTLFLSVAAFLLNMVIGRMVRAQREQIAVLKAFGYSAWEIAEHYLNFVAVIVVLGASLGTCMGALFGRTMTGMYKDFFRFPEIRYDFDYRVVLGAVAVSTLAAAVGTVSALRQAASMPPAEAMRPEPPARYRQSIVERLGLRRLLSQATRMVIRHLERQPVRSALAVLAISLATAMLVVGGFVVHVIDRLIEYTYVEVQRQDLTVTFNEPVSGSALAEIRTMPGVLQAEPFRALPARLRAGPAERRLAVMGLDPARSLFVPRNVDGRPVDIPDHGIVLTSTLADILGVQAGDAVTIEVLEEARPTRDVVVSGLTSEMAGLSAYMSLSAANTLMREEDSISGAHILADPAALHELYTTLKETPQVSSVTVKDATVTVFRETVARNILAMRMLNISFAVIIAFGVVYNTARILLAERSRELATLRVIGFTRAEISLVLLGEIAVLVLVALPLGLPLGRTFAAILVAVLQTEDYRFPLVIQPPTYAFAALIVLLAAAVSGLVVRRRIDELNLLAVLKAQE